MNHKLLAAFLCAVVLSGCSKKQDESSAEASADSAVVAADSAQTEAVAVSAEHEPNATPVTSQKPDVILNTEVNAAEATRRMVREASVTFTAQDVVKTTLAVEKITLEAGGFIEQKNIDFNVVDSRSQKIADGKVKVFEKVDPLAAMVIRVPSERAAGVVNQLLPLMYFLNQQQYSAKRYELRMLEEKISQTQHVPSDTRNAQLSEISRLTRMEVQDRVRYSTITLAISQPTLVRERIDVDVDAVARLNGDSFWKRAWNGIQYGWHFVLDLLVLLITIWPLYLLAIGAYLLYRLCKPWINKVR
ncbi:hypothetical protein AMD27_09205 [Acinetobacter sp. TGL-Y2]|uniref:DUF4349 domain-containing protein n=1 Tax=Acinetobacter sp. TGL-Y2 TaxID=1407071 RepID=UPI0007A6711F|nr:DUF4349 domain-containing protein [Acinetobacter sp. TGL-Y2]AMW79047.1 hypothetical protein AMD27_09205 [Acinetobacter sp. TGL-Y2]